MSRVGTITGEIAATRGPEKPSAQAVADYFEAASSINDLTEIIKTIQTIMSNVSESAKAEIAIRGESTLGKSNPFHGMIMQEINDLQGAGNYLLVLLPVNSEEFKRVEALVKQLGSIGENPTKGALDALPNIARTFMEMSEKLPSGVRVHAGEQGMLTEVYRDRFWAKMGSMFTNMNQQWEMTLNDFQQAINGLEESKKKLTALKEELQSKVFNPINSGTGLTPEKINQIFTTINSIDWSQHPVGAKDNFVAALLGFKGPSIEGKQATIAQLVTARFIMSKFEEWIAKNPNAAIGTQLGRKTEQYFALFAFIKDSLEPLRGSSLFDEALAKQLLDSTVGDTNLPLTRQFPLTLMNIPMRGAAEGIPLAQVKLITPPQPAAPYLTFVMDPRLPSNPDFMAAFTLQQQTTPVIFTKQFQALDEMIDNKKAFLDFHAPVSKDISQASQAVADARLNLLLPRDQISQLMIRVSETILASVSGPTLKPDDGFYELVSTQLSSLIDIGGFLIESLPPDVDKTALLANLNQLKQLQALTTNIPPLPLPKDGIAQLPSIGRAFMEASIKITAPANADPSWPSKGIPSGIRQATFWQKFANMFEELSAYPESIKQTATDALADIRATQEIANQIRPILQGLQTKVLDQLMQGAPITEVLDDLSLLLQELHKFDLSKYPDFQKEVDTVLNSFLALKGPAVDGKQTTFQDMLTSAIILREMARWFNDDAHRNLPLYPTLPGPISGNGFGDGSNFFRDGSGRIPPKSITGQPGSGLLDSIRGHFQNYWPQSALIDPKRIEEMLAVPTLPPTDPSKPLPIVIPGLLVQGHPSPDGTGTTIGQIWPFNWYQNIRSPDTFNSFPPPPENEKWIGTWGFVYTPDLKFFESDALKKALSIPDQDSLKRVSDAINNFPSNSDFEKRAAQQQAIIDFITDSHIVEDLTRAQWVAKELSNTALLNSPLPDALRIILLERALPVQQAILEKYGMQLYFLNSAIRIYNTIDTATSDFLAAGTNYSASSQITSRFTHVAVAPNDYYLGDAESAKSIIEAQRSRTESNLNALNGQVAAIDTAIVNINKDTTISPENKKLLTKELQDIQANMRQAVKDLTAMRDFLQNVQVNAQNPIDGKKNFVITFVPPPGSGQKQLRNEEVISQLRTLENNVVNGIPNPQNKEQNIGGLTNINKMVTANRQNHSSMTDEAQLQLQNAMTKIQQMWTIVATMIQLLNQMYLTVARGVKGG